MASTNFSYGTVIASTWLNDVNAAVYTTLPSLLTRTTGTNTGDQLLFRGVRIQVSPGSFGPTTTPSSTTDNFNFAAGTNISLSLDSTAKTLTINGTDQLAFKNFAVSGQPTVVATAAGDTMTLVAGSGMTITTDATAKSVTLSSTSTSSMVLLASTTVTSGSPVANIDYLNLFTSAYDKYIIEMTGFQPTSASRFSFRVAVGGNVQVTSSYVVKQVDGQASSAMDTALVLGYVNPSGLTPTANYTLTISNTANAIGIKPVLISGMHYNTNNAYEAFLSMSAYASAQVVSGFRLFCTTGTTIASGTVRIYGIKNT